MNIPEITPYEEQAIDTVVSVLNSAKEILGDRQTLTQLASTRDVLSPPSKVTLAKLRNPLAITCEELIKEVIEKEWKLTDTVMYMVKFMGGSQDECCLYYYYEAIFSQPTVAYPIPQATVSVFFRVEDKLLRPVDARGVPMLLFRIEGQHTEHDVRHVRLTADWLLGVIQMKVRLYRRIEEIRLF